MYRVLHSLYELHQCGCESLLARHARLQLLAPVLNEDDLLDRYRRALFLHNHDEGLAVTCDVVSTDVALAKIVALEEFERVRPESGQLNDSGVHRLRHTFCSHLSMRGAPARAIQELAGHKDLSTTQRYMHLSRRQSRAQFGCSICRRAVRWRRGN